MFILEVSKCLFFLKKMFTAKSFKFGVTKFIEFFSSLYFLKKKKKCSNHESI